MNEGTRLQLIVPPALDICAPNFVAAKELEDIRAKFGAKDEKKGLKLASCFFKKMGQPRSLFVYFRSFQIQLYRKIIGFSKIQTWIVGVEGEHADQLTTTTDLEMALFI